MEATQIDAAAAARNAAESERIGQSFTEHLAAGGAGLAETNGDVFDGLMAVEKHGCFAGLNACAAAIVASAEFGVGADGGANVRRFARIVTSMLTHAVADWPEAGADPVPVFRAKRGETAKLAANAGLAGLTQRPWWADTPRAKGDGKAAPTDICAKFAGIQSALQRIVDGKAKAKGGKNGHTKAEVSALLDALNVFIKEHVTKPEPKADIDA